MAYLNPIAQLMHLNIAYYGPALAGKTTNLRYLFRHGHGLAQSPWMELAEPFPLVGFYYTLAILTIDGAKLCLHLSAVPGQVFQDLGRRQLLRNVDGIVFVADSDPRRDDANRESAENLFALLAEQRRAPGANVPIVVQFNKYDLPDAQVGDLHPGLDRAPRIRTAATQGHGVLETLKELVKRLMSDFRTGRAQPMPLRLLKTPDDPLQLWKLFRTNLGRG